MKQFCIFLSVLTTLGCNTQRAVKSTAPRKVADAAYFDSLKAMHPDILISYAPRCVGCINDTNRTYFLWQENGVSYASKVQDSIVYEIRKIGDIGKFEKYFDSIQHEKWKEPPYLASHYFYEDFTIDNKDYSIRHSVTSYERAPNESTYRVKFVSALDSTVKSIKNSAWQKASNTKL